MLMEEEHYLGLGAAMLCSFSGERLNRWRERKAVELDALRGKMPGVMHKR